MFGSIFQVAVLALCLAVASGYRDQYRNSGSSLRDKPSNSEVRDFARCARTCTNDLLRAVKTKDQDLICRSYPVYEQCVRHGCGELGENYFKNKVEHDKDFDALERRCELRRSSGRDRSSSGRTRYGSSSGGTYPRNRGSREGYPSRSSSGASDYSSGTRGWSR